MSQQHPIRAVFFDLGGTLFRYPQRMGGGMGQVLRTFGISAAPEEIGTRWRQAASAAGEHYNRQRYFLHRDLFRDTLNGFLQSFGHEADPATFQAFHESQLQALLEHMPIREDCRDALAALRERGLYLSVVSNIDDDYLFPILETHGLVDFFEHCISSEQARSCKPDPDIYHYALRKAGRETAEVLFVGDSLHHDIAGAHGVGMRSARVVEAGTTTPLTHGLEVVAEPTYEIRALLELVEIVDGVNNR